MKGTHINWRFIKYHAIPKVKTKSASRKSQRNYQKGDKAKELMRNRSQRYRERKSVLVDIGTLNQEGGL